MERNSRTRDAGTSAAARPWRNATRNAAPATSVPTPEESWEMVNAFFNCADPKEQPEFIYRRGSLVKLSEDCLASDATVARLRSFAAWRVTDRSDKKYDPRKELIGF